MDENLTSEQNVSDAGELRKSKIFFVVFFLILFLSIAATYYRTMIKKDYLISAQIDCDPYVEKCFIWNCDPNSVVEGEACTGDPESDIWYYKIFERKAYNVPLCNPDDENCDAYTCAEEEKNCAEILCNEENKVEQGVECNDPEEYTLNNPEEEEAECEGDDCEAAEEECDSETDDCTETESEETTEDEAAEDAEDEVESELPAATPTFPVK
jgi:hypothetical protein